MAGSSLRNEQEFLRRQIEDLAVRLEDKIAELSVIKEMGQALASIEDFPETCRTILNVVIRNTLAQNFSIMLHDEVDGRLFLVAASDPEYNDFVASANDILLRTNLRYSFHTGQGVAGLALAEGRSLLIEDAAHSPFFTTEVPTDVVVGSLLSIPMIYQERAVGVINVSHREPGIFKQHDLYLFNILADLVALLIESSLAHQRLKLSEEKYRVLAENANDGIAIIQDNRHVYTNPRYQEMTGYSAEELAGMSFDSILRCNGPQFQFFSELASCSDSGQGLIKGMLVSRDGRQMEIEASVATIRHEGSGATLVAARDLTYRRHLERQLRQFQKMEAIGTLAGGIAHDFNNILSAIIGYAELSVRKIPLSNPVHVYLEQILNAGDRAKNLIRQILTFSRQSEQERSVIPIDPIIKESLKLLRSTIPASITIRQRVTSGCQVLADPTQIQQIIMNLAINASHAMQPDGGILEIFLEKVTLDDNGKKGNDLPPGDYALLRVADSGQGMDAATLERIFEPYFTTKEQGVGTGMGLAVVHGIVESHGGFIRVESSPGNGTRFDIYLPRIRQQRKNAAPLEEEMAEGSESILFIDDEEPLAMMGAELLGELGYRVTAVTSSVEAIKRVQDTPDAFDLVITDESMPKMTGTQLAAVLHAMIPNVPIILCSGNIEGISRQATDRAGISRVVAKPFKSRQMGRIIREVLGSTRDR